MVGGTVKEVLISGSRVWVNVEHVTPRYRDECAIYVERNDASERIRPGDALWWQGNWAMWTPQENRGNECNCREHVSCTLRCGVDYDIRIPRIGHSGVSHPAKALVDQAYSSL